MLNSDEHCAGLGYELGFNEPNAAALYFLEGT